ncbi:MAG: alpha/beta hydrolase [Pseudomonadales bacterium]|nr:alpha/beta hydrolase [Pseudomonadales bacterium]
MAEQSKYYSDSEAPGWFIEAVNTPYQNHFIEVDSCKIHYQKWDNTGNKPGLLFVSGGGAHTHWWDFIAPSLLAKYNIAAIDVSGMGDSGHREVYSTNQYAKELMAVIDDAGLGDNTIIAAHSYGGHATLKAGLEYADRLGGIVVIDSAVFPPDFQRDTETMGPSFNAKKVYPDLETAMTRFKLLPPQPCENDYIVKFIAYHSLGKVEGGYSWKFDTEFVVKKEVDELQSEIPNLKIKATVIHGENSMFFFPFFLNHMKEVYPDHVPILSLPNAAHHLFLDQPQEFVKLLDGVLETY